MSNDRETYRTIGQLNRVLLDVKEEGAGTFTSAAHPAAAQLVENWKPRLHRGASVEDVAADVDRVVEELLRFKESVLELEPTAAPGPRR